MPSKRRGKKVKKEHLAVRGVKAVHRHFWDHFIPHKGNSHVPHVLQHRVLLGYSVLILLLKVLVVATPIMIPSASLYSSSITASNVIMLTNQTRFNMGLSALTRNTALMAAAQNKAEDMLAKQYFSHNSPDGLSPWYFIKGQGYAYDRAGENLAVHYTSAEGVHQGWLASPAHRANIVKEEFTEIGVGIVNGEFEGNPSTIVVQFFGKPKDMIMSDDTLQYNSESSEMETVSSVHDLQELENESKAVSQVDLSNDTDSYKGSETVVEGEKNEQIVNASQLVVKPADEQGIYKIQVPAVKAESVGVQMGSNWIELKKNKEKEVWEGHVAGALSYDKGGEVMQLIVQDKNGKIFSRTAMIAAPGLSVQDFFIFNDAPVDEIKLFGLFSINNLDDSVKKFYFFFMMFLVSAIILKILIKVHIQKPTVLVHACFVLGLAVFLFLL